MSFNFKKSTSKYGNVGTRIGGFYFRSKAEAAYYEHLIKQKACGKIKHFDLQPRIALTKAKIVYVPDFRIVLPDNSYFYVDIKGAITDVFAIKLRLWRFYGDGRLDLIKLKRKEWVVVDSCTTLEAPRQGT